MNLVSKCPASLSFVRIAVFADAAGITGEDGRGFKASDGTPSGKLVNITTQSTSLQKTLQLQPPTTFLFLF